MAGGRRKQGSEGFKCTKKKKNERIYDRNTDLETRM